MCEFRVLYPINIIISLTSLLFGIMLLVYLSVCRITKTLYIDFDETRHAGSGYLLVNLAQLLRAHDR